MLWGYSWRSAQEWPLRYTQENIYGGRDSNQGRSWCTVSLTPDIPFMKNKSHHLPSCHISHFLSFYSPPHIFENYFEALKENRTFRTHCFLFQNPMNQVAPEVGMSTDQLFLESHKFHIRSASNPRTSWDHTENIKIKATGKRRKMHKRLLS